MVHSQLENIQSESRPCVRVSYVDLDKSVDTIRTSEQVLDSDERDRAHRFRFDTHRNHYILCRSALRQILAERLGIEPAELKFEYGPYGKPYLHRQWPNL